MPFFTVITTTYNRPLLLKRALNSLLLQKEKDWEGIIVDDGSTDTETRPFLNNFIEVNPQFKLVAKPSNQGSEKARNAGIQLATGQYITFLDSDDEYLPNHLEVRRKILENHPEIELLHGGVEVIGPSMIKDKDDATHLIPVQDCAVGGTFFIKRQLVKRLNGFKEIKYASDADFLERAKQTNAVIQKIETPTYRYHRESWDSITHNFE